MPARSKSWGSWKWANAQSTHSLTWATLRGWVPVAAPRVQGSPQQPRWEMPLEMSRFLPLLMLLSLWCCSGWGNLPGLPYDTGGSRPSRQLLVESLDGGLEPGQKS